MSQDYTVAKELASLKEIKQSAEQRISELSLNALNYVNDHRLHKADGGGGGTGGGVLVCTLPNQGNTLDKTWKEIHDAFPSSVVVLISNGEGQSQMLLATSVGFADELYYVGFTVFNDNGSSKKYYSVATENGYPVEEIS